MAACCLFRKRPKQRGYADTRQTRTELDGLHKLSGHSFRARDSVAWRAYALRCERFLHWMTHLFSCFPRGAYMTASLFSQSQALKQGHNPAAFIRVAEASPLVRIRSEREHKIEPSRLDAGTIFSWRVNLELESGGPVLLPVPEKLLK